MAQTQAQANNTFGLTQATVFQQNYVKVLTADDFNIRTKEPITLKWDDCIIVLFYGNNIESENLARIWSLVARSAAGPIFAAVNISVHRQVAEAFAKVKMTNSTLRPFALKGFPTIITYQNGWPVGFYNGERAVQPLVDYAMTLACQPYYFEPQQLAKGVEVDRNYEMGGFKYHKPATTSVQFKVGDPYRGYNNRQPLTVVGSPAASAAAIQGQQADIEQGAVPLAAPESPQETLGSGVQPLSSGEAGEAAGLQSPDEPIVPGEESLRSAEAEERAAAATSEASLEQQQVQGQAARTTEGVIDQERAQEEAQEERSRSLAQEEAAREAQEQQR